MSRRRLITISIGFALGSAHLITAQELSKRDECFKFLLKIKNLPMKLVEKPSTPENIPDEPIAEVSVPDFSNAILANAESAPTRIESAKEVQLEVQKTEPSPSPQTGIENVSFGELLDRGRTFVQEAKEKISEYFQKPKEKEEVVITEETKEVVREAIKDAAEWVQEKVELVKEALTPETKVPAPNNEEIELASFRGVEPFSHQVPTPIEKEKSLLHADSSLPSLPKESSVLDSRQKPKLIPSPSFDIQKPERNEEKNEIEEKEDEEDLSGDSFKIIPKKIRRTEGVTNRSSVRVSPSYSRGNYVVLNQRSNPSDSKSFSYFEGNAKNQNSNDATDTPSDRKGSAIESEPSSNRSGELGGNFMNDRAEGGLSNDSPNSARSPFLEGGNDSESLRASEMEGENLFASSDESELSIALRETTQTLPSVAQGSYWKEAARKISSIHFVSAKAKSIANQILQGLQLKYRFKYRPLETAALKEVEEMFEAPKFIRVADAPIVFNPTKSSKGSKNPEPMNDPNGEKWANESVMYRKLRNDEEDTSDEETQG